MEDRLVQEQLHDGDLTARLDDARNLLRDKGIDSDTRLGSRSRETKNADPDDELSQPRTLPAGRTTRKPPNPPRRAFREISTNCLRRRQAHLSAGTISFRGNDVPARRPLFDDDARPQPMRITPLATRGQRFRRDDSSPAMKLNLGPFAGIRLNEYRPTAACSTVRSRLSDTRPARYHSARNAQQDTQSIIGGSWHHDCNY